jgi:hypothetical protein
VRWSGDAPCTLERGIVTRRVHLSAGVVTRRVHLCAGVVTRRVHLSAELCHSAYTCALGVRSRFALGRSKCVLCIHRRAERMFSWYLWCAGVRAWCCSTHGKGVLSAVWRVGADDSRGKGGLPWKRQARLPRPSQGAMGASLSRGRVGGGPPPLPGCWVSILLRRHSPDDA